MAEAEDLYVEKRKKYLQESIDTSCEPKWGYFGGGGTLAIGDNSYAPKMIRKPKDEEGGDPVRNICTRPTLKGAGVDVYFTFEPPIGLGDPYQDPGAINRKGKIWMIDPEAKFKPPGKVTEPVNKGFEYIPHCDSKRDPIAMREKFKESGPRNMICNPTKKGGGGVYTPGVLFGMDENRFFPEAMADDYDSAGKMRRKDLEEHKAKLQEAAFKQSDYGNRCFSTNEETMHYDIPTHIPRDPVPPGKTGAFPHEAAFKPSNPTKKGIAPVGGVSGLIGGFAEWQAEPPPEGAKRKEKVEGAEDKMAFRLGAPRAALKPTPSVTTNMRNMRNERPSSFARPHI